ncbi:hypothetical protein RRG08_056059 [Elysia crispata]|uniref:Uncharacterized protein n=1 Tax=Elysia crispata TaxID=231223 RepID=A0AAE0ZBU2_9GAST|nr:hypothetical protein RRG08_056059 [Elysia crispata]
MYDRRPKISAGGGRVKGVEGKEPLSLFSGQLGATIGYPWGINSENKLRADSVPCCLAWHCQGPENRVAGGRNSHTLYSEDWLASDTRALSSHEVNGKETLCPKVLHYLNIQRGSLIHSANVDVQRGAVEFSSFINI